MSIVDHVMRSQDQFVFSTSSSHSLHGRDDDVRLVFVEDASGKGFFGRGRLVNFDVISAFWQKVPLPRIADNKSYFCQLGECVA